MEFEAEDNKEYEVKAIIDSAVYSQQANDQMLGLDYLVSWKSYSKEENTWETSSIIIHLRKLISTFHKEYPEKPIVISLLLHSALSIARPTIPKEQKQKRDHPNKGVNKQSKK